MQTITSADFNRDNVILSRYKLLPCAQSGDSCRAVVDTNRNGMIDSVCSNDDSKLVYVPGQRDTFSLRNWENFVSPRGHYDGCRTTTTTLLEPCLPYSDLEHWAQNHQTEVICADNFVASFKLSRDRSVEQYSGSGQRVAEYKETIDEGTPEDLAKKLEPFESGAKWAIDMAQREFIIYRP